MTLIITLIAAVIATAVWYGQKDDSWQVSALCWMYWGAGIMWVVDAVFEYAELGAAYFTPALEDMLNDIYLGLSVVVLGLVIWIVRLLIKDPNHKLRKTAKEEAHVQSI